jgi:hypothetical protein
MIRIDWLIDGSNMDSRGRRAFVIGMTVCMLFPDRSLASLGSHSTP